MLFFFIYFCLYFCLSFVLSLSFFLSLFPYRTLVFPAMKASHLWFPNDRHCIQNHLNNTLITKRDNVFEGEKKRFYSLETCPLFIFREELHPHQIHQESRIQHKNWSSPGIKHAHTSSWAKLPQHLKGTLRRFKHFISRPRFFYI